MGVIYFMLAISLLLSLGFLLAFLWANKKSQFSDLESPAWRALDDGSNLTTKNNNKKEGARNGREI